jgi:hypothetical protein
MAFETWGAFSVTEHLARKAFVADVLLYEKLVIPVPDKKERKRWIEPGRKPEVLDRKLEILEGGPAKGRSQSKSTHRTRLRLDAATPDIVAATPDIVAAYTSYEAMHDNLKLAARPLANGLSTDPPAGIIGNGARRRI